MLASADKYICVSIHDVAPATWPECQRLVDAIREVADIPITFLVVPRYHGDENTPPEYIHELDALHSRGHELALHGYVHWDSAPDARSLRSRFLRTVYTQREGEFAAIGVEEARRRIGLGLAWFHDRGWPVAGFVPPAWLLGPGAWAALREFSFEYTTNLTSFYHLPSCRSLFSPSLVYMARNAAGRALSPRWASLLGRLLENRELVRLSLHPRDARDPKLLRHSQYLLEKLLTTRIPMTKIAFARQWTEKVKAGKAALAVMADTSS